MTANQRDRVDMSPAAIAARLEQVRALYQLMLSLQQIQTDPPRPGRR